MIVAFALAGLWLSVGIAGYHIVSMPSPDALANPLTKVVEHQAGAWLVNYSAYPWSITSPALAFAGAALTILLSQVRRPGFAFLTSALTMAGVITTAGFAMFPFIMPSSTQPNSSLTVWDATSSPLTLTVMFWATVVFLPIVIGYTIWTYRSMWGRVTVEQIRETTHSAY